MLRFEQDGRVVVITLDRPDARNAIDGPMAQAIEAAITRVEDDDTVMVGIVTHTGNVFCSGADLKAVRRGEGGMIRTPRGGFAGIEKRVRSKPLIAAVEGKALGGGFEIALACDLIVASTDAQFALPEVSHSLLPTAGGVTRLTWAIPTRIALELILTAAPMDAARAAELGLVSRVVAPGEALSEARQLAEAIARNAPLAVRAARRLVLEATTHNDEARIRALSDQEWLVIHASEDFQEGPRAFAEKRPPRWQGR